MFTGIIEELGCIENIFKKGSIATLEIKADKVLDGVRIGDSISVNGVCLTVVKKEDSVIGFEIMQETLKLTNLGSVRIGDKVNLERALRLSDRLSGHFVTGHIDCIGTIKNKKQAQGNLSLEVTVPQGSMDYIVPKGSVAVDGISLTVVEKKSSSFITYLIPHTIKNTTLGLKGPSSKVNVEFDILAKYAT